MIFRIIICLALMGSTAFGTTWFVNNQTGKDTNDGQSERKAFATFARTVKECKTSDKIVLINTGVPYREQLNLTNLGGTPADPFIIEGNGAVLNGFREIKTEEWKNVGKDLYFIALDMSSFKTSTCYLLLSDGQRVRHRTKASKAEELKPGEWLAGKDGIYFKCDEGKPIADHQISGICLIRGLIMIVNSSYIICRNIITEYSLDDGIDGAGECRGLYFENIESRNNSGQPISFHDRCEATVRNAYFHHNGTGIVDVNHSRTYYIGVLCEENESGCGFNSGFHTMTDCILRNNGKGRCQLNIHAGPVTHLTGHENSPMNDARVCLKNVVITCDTNTPGNGISMTQADANSQLIMENCLISGCNTALWAITKKPTDDSFCHVTASAFVNCGALILNDNPASKFRFHGDYNVYGPAEVKWLDKKYPATELEAFLKANGSDKESKIGTLTIKDGRPVDESGSLLKVKLQSIGPRYWLNTNEVFNELKGKNKP